MEILQPVEQVQKENELKSVPQELSQALVDKGLTLENLQVLDYLQMKDSLFDEKVMSKVQKIAELTRGKDLQEIDLRLGNPNNMTRLDKIYSYLMLEQQEREIMQRRELLNKEKQRYEIL